MILFFFPIPFPPRCPTFRFFYIHLFLQRVFFVVFLSFFFFLHPISARLPACVFDPRVYERIYRLLFFHFNSRLFVLHCLPKAPADFL